MSGQTFFRRNAPHRPAAGVSEFDPLVLADAVLEVAHAALERAGRVDSVAIANQRASTVVWDRKTGRPLGPGIGWQDLRTIGQCLTLKAAGLRLAPNQSATKLAYLLASSAGDADAEPIFGTLDTWIAWQLTNGALHVTDSSNAAVTGLLRADASGWDEEVLAALKIDAGVLPALVASSGLLGEAGALPGAPLLAGLVGDQQASLIGQGCTTPGAVKATFGSGGMLDLCVGTARPGFAVHGERGTFPIVAWRDDAGLTWGIEAILLAAGTCVEWLRDGLGLIASVEESDALAASVRDSGGVTFVPAFGGLGTPLWDFGARGALVGLDQSTTRAEIVHAVLDGIAHAGADLLEAVEGDAAVQIAELRVDGGMSANGTFLQLLADATGRPVLPSEITEATTLGAAFLAGTATGRYPSVAATAALARHRAVVEPRRRADRDRRRDARARALKTVPFLSTLEF